MIHVGETDVGQAGRDVEASRARGGKLDSGQAVLGTIELRVKMTIKTREREGTRSQQMPIVSYQIPEKRRGIRKETENQGVKKKEKKIRREGRILGKKEC